LIAAVYTWPLLREARSRIAADPFDPILNASILWWNATVVPFTAGWWSPPFFFPAENVAAFTENLAGLGVVATPVFWITGQPILTYNLTLFLAWPLSALAAYLLAFEVTRRRDAAFLAGLAFAFAPYRLSQLGHLQVLSIYWLPLALLGLHRYLSTAGSRWLVLFGVAWLAQSLSNGYYMFFGGVLIGLWIAYFCSPRAAWRTIPAIVLAWIVASVPVALIMWKYRVVHEHYGLTRGLQAAIGGSAQPVNWFQTAFQNRFWSALLPDGGGEFNLFPGVTCLAMVTAAVAIFIGQRTERDAGRRRAMRVCSAMIAFAGVAVLVTIAAAGPLRFGLLGATIRLSSVGRAASITVLAVSALIVVTPAIRVRLRGRSPFAFYCGALLAIVVLACGPEIRSAGGVLLAPAPYGWLMSAIPALESLRIVARFWMVGTLCLAMAAAIGYGWVAARLRTGGWALAVLLTAGVLADAWPRAMPMAPAPVERLALERRDDPAAILELPLGPMWDAAATFRSIGHGRRVVNGVSGYDPPHYAPLQAGLVARDPTVLAALASFGPIDVILDNTQDPAGGLATYLEASPLVSRVRQDEARTLYRLMRVRWPTPGPALSAAGTETLAGEVTIDLGSTQSISGVEIAAHRNLNAVPEQLVIETSSDRITWRSAWSGSTRGAILRAAALNPSDLRVTLNFETTARFVRMRVAEPGPQVSVLGVR